MIKQTSTFGEQRVSRPSIQAHTQNLEQVMKRASEILKKSRQSISMNATATLSNHTDFTDIEADSNRLTTADSQKYSLSTNREAYAKVTPFLSSSQSPPTSAEGGNRLIYFRDDAYPENLIESTLVETPQKSEADLLFDNFDSFFKVTFVSSKTPSMSLNSRDSVISSNQAVRSLASVLEQTHKEESLKQKDSQSTYLNHPSFVSTRYNIPTPIQQSRSHSQSIPSQSSRSSNSEIIQHSRTQCNAPLTNNQENLAKKIPLPIKQTNLNPRVQEASKYPVPVTLAVSHHPPPLPSRPSMQEYNIYHFTNATKVRQRQSSREREQCMHTSTPTGQGNLLPSYQSSQGKASCVPSSNGFFHTPLGATQDYTKYLQSHLNPSTNAGASQLLSLQRQPSNDQQFQSHNTSMQMPGNSQLINKESVVQRQRSSSTFTSQQQGDRLTQKDMDYSQSTRQGVHQIARQRASVHIPSAEGRFSKPFLNYQSIDLSSASSSRVLRPSFLSNSQIDQQSNTFQPAGSVKGSLHLQTFSQQPANENGHYGTQSIQETWNYHSVMSNQTEGPRMPSATRPQAVYVMPKK